MRVEVKAMGAGASGKSYALNKITALLEELGFVSLRHLTNEHQVVYYREDDYHRLQGSVSK